MKTTINESIDKTDYIGQTRTQNKDKKGDDSMKKGYMMLLCVMIFAALGAVCVVINGDKDEGCTPEARQAAIGRAYLAGEKAIDQGIANVDQWYKTVIDARAEKAADALIGWRAKWEYMTLPKEEFKAFQQKVLEKNLYTQAEKKKMVAVVVGSVARQWMDIENTLAVETGCHALTTEAKAHEIKAHPANLPKEGVNDALQKDIYRELASNVGGEVAAAIAVQLATSAGILGTSTAFSWETLGISVVVGVIVDVIVGKIMDNEEKVRQQLVKSLAVERDELKKKLRDGLTEALKKRRLEWEEQI